MKEAMAKRIEANGGHGLNFGKHLSEQARQNIREAQLKVADKHRESRLGKKLSPESIAKRTENRIAKYGCYHTSNDPSAKPVYCEETGQKFSGINELSRELGVSRYYARKFVETQCEFNGMHYNFVNEKDRKEEKQSWHWNSKKLAESKSESKLISPAPQDQERQ